MFCYNSAFADSMYAYSMNWFMNPFMNLYSNFNMFNFSFSNLINSMFSPFNIFSSVPQYSSFMPLPAPPTFNINAPLFSFNNNMNMDSFMKSSPAAGDVNDRMVAKAKSYIGVVNSSAEGNRLFSPPNYRTSGWYRKHHQWGWCCDFAVHCLKETLGSKFPSDMITSSPSGLAGKAKNHNAYMATPASNKASWIANNVRKGDIIYMKGCGISGRHIAIVEYVRPDGSIHAISGNYASKVKDHEVKPSETFGFISVAKLASGNSMA